MMFIMSHVSLPWGRCSLRSSAYGASVEFHVGIAHQGNLYPTQLATFTESVHLYRYNDLSLSIYIYIQTPVGTVISNHTTN